MSLVGFDIYDKLSVDYLGYHRMPECQDYPTSPYSTVPYQGSIISPTILFRYFVNTSTRHRIHVHAAQNVTSLYKAIRAGMPTSSSTLDHWVRCRILSPEFGQRSYISTFVSNDIYYTLDEFNILVCEASEDYEWVDDIEFTMETIEIVYREFL